MQHADYVIIGASHAALSALHTLRMHDAQGSVTMLTREASLPYSPTVLPYVVSGRSSAERVFLRDARYFAEQDVDYRQGCAAARVDGARNVVELDDGEAIEYGKLLVASGARPVVPAIPGLDHVAYHVLRTLDDAVALHRAVAGAQRALVLGAGLIGMHAAENLAKAGASVTVVEREAHVLPAYFDPAAAGIIERIFAQHGVRIATGTQLIAVDPGAGGSRALLGGGNAIDFDVLVVGVGVVPVTDFLSESGIDVDRGVIVDDLMRSSIPNVWAAGDVAQARDFYDGGKKLNGILPDAVEQGRIAGMAMAGDPGVKAYPGGVPLNTYTFFGHQAVAVGAHGESLAGTQTIRSVDPARNRYLEIVLAGDRLVGIFGIDTPFDPGVMWELILRRIDLGPLRERFIDDPQHAARILMSRTWR